MSHYHEPLLVWFLSIPTSVVLLMQYMLWYFLFKKLLSYPFVKLYVPIVFGLKVQLCNKCLVCCVTDASPVVLVIEYIIMKSLEGDSTRNKSKQVYLYLFNNTLSGMFTPEILVLKPQQKIATQCQESILDSTRQSFCLPLFIYFNDSLDTFY